MYKNVLQSIENIQIWPIVSLSIFFIFFLCMALWWWQMDKDHIDKMSKMPFDEDDEPSDSPPSKPSKPWFGGFKKSLKVFATMVLLMIANPLLAQSQSGGGVDSVTLFLILVAAVILVSILVLMVAIYLLVVLRTMLSDEQRKKAEETGVEYVEEPGWFKRLSRGATDAVPVAQEHTILLAHEYDGIRELDNHLPPWWKWLFYVTIIWGVGYLIAYHVIEVLPLQGQEYANEVAQAEEAAAARLANASEEGTLIDENTVVMVSDASALADGEKIYQANCAACHKADGGGSIGPNLTDAYWIHGGGIKNVFRTVKYGVVEKGMIPWESVLNPEQMQNVSSYILTMQGTNPAGAKEPQGEVWEEEAPAEADSTAMQQAMLVR